MWLIPTFAEVTEEKLVGEASPPPPSPMHNRVKMPLINCEVNLEYRSEKTNQAKNNNFNYLIDSKFQNVNRLSFENENDRRSYSSYYVSKIKITNYNFLIDGESFFEILIGTKNKHMKKIIRISRDNDYNKKR